MRSRSAVFAILFLAFLAGGFAYWRLTTEPPPGNEDIVSTPPASPVPATNRAETEEEKSRHQLLGTWQDHYKGKRTMTLKEDGTGTMRCELSGVQATLFASKLRFDM